MNNKKILALFITLLFLLPIAVAISYPTLTGYVTDNANIITPEYKQKITDLAENINKNTTVEIAVLTVESLEGDSPENYAVQTFRQNGVGKKDNNNGLLILVAKNERKYRFEVGYGLEGTIPDAMKVPIGDKIITPNFKKGEYGKGIYESMLVIEGLVTNNTEVLSKYGLIDSGGGDGAGDVTGSATIFIFSIIVFIIIIGAITFLISLKNGGVTSYTYPPNYTTPSVPTHRASPSSYGSNSRKSISSNSSFGNSGIVHSHIHHNNGGFGGFSGGRSGGGGFGGGW